jgi:predicted FMN-binding regulatory protein PaiB
MNRPFSSVGAASPRIFAATCSPAFKLSQNRAPAERANVHSAHAAGSPDQQALAAWMERLGNH